MLIRHAYKFRVIANPRIRYIFGEYAEACRIVYNRGVALHRENIKETGKKLKTFEVHNLLPGWKVDHEDKDAVLLASVPHAILNQTLNDLNKAYQNFFKKHARVPSFKRKGECSSFRFPSTTVRRLEEYKYPKASDSHTMKTKQPIGCIEIARFGKIRFYQSRAIIGKLKNVTFSRKGDKWFVAFQTEYEDPDVLETPTLAMEKALAIDFGMLPFLTTHTGIKYESPRPYLTFLHKIQHLQSIMKANKIYGSRYEKFKCRLANLHASIQNIREDWMHKIANELVKSPYDIIVIPLRKIKEIQSKKKGEVNRNLYDTAWQKFTIFLDYKLREANKRLYPVACERLEWVCKACGCVHPNPFLNPKAKEADEEADKPIELICLECGQTEQFLYEFSSQLEAQKILEKYLDEIGEKT